MLFTRYVTSEDDEIKLLSRYIVMVLNALCHNNWSWCCKWTSKFSVLGSSVIASTECVLLVSNSVSTAYGMQVSAEKTQLMTNDINGTSADFTTDNKKLETAHRFKYLGAIVSDQGLKPQVLSRTAHITAAVNQKSSGTTKTSPAAPRSNGCAPWSCPY